MKSRIPYPKPAEVRDKSPQEPRDIPSTVHAAIELLGAPHLEVKEFHRLYHGTLADVLLFVSEHMKGRRQIALARTEIHRYVRRNRPVQGCGPIRRVGCGRCVPRHY